MKRFRYLILFILVLSVLNTLPASAENSGNTDTLTYGDIEKRVLEGNLQLKLSRLSLNKLEDGLDDAEESAERGNNAIYGLINKLRDASEAMEDIVGQTADPDIAAIADTVKFSLALTENSVYSQLVNTKDSKDRMAAQIEITGLSLQQAEKTLVNTARSMYVLFYQLTNSLEKQENTRALLSGQLNLAYTRLRYSMVSQASVKELEAALKENDASYTSLLNQRDALMLQIKILLGLTSDARLSLGEMPDADLNYINTLELSKDIKAALSNALSIKIKASELDSASASYFTEKYELQMKSSDAELNFTKQYQALIEKRDDLLISESRLEMARSKLEQGQIKYRNGALSKIELMSLESNVKSQELTVEGDSASLFFEIENYKAMKNGML